MEIYIAKRAKHIEKTTTEKQPYLLDDLYFAITKDDVVVAVIRDDSRVGQEPVYRDIFSGKEYNNVNILYGLKTSDITDPTELKGINGFDIKDYLKSAGIRNLFSGKVYRNLKSHDAFNFPEGSPKMGYRASKEQIAALLKDIQKGYDVKLGKEQQKEPGQE